MVCFGPTRVELLKRDESSHLKYLTFLIGFGQHVRIPITHTKLIKNVICAMQRHNIYSVNIRIPPPI